MAVYKVPQDVEAEDKLVGPFTFRQSVYMGIAVGAGGLTFLFIRAPIPFPFFAALTVPVMIGFLVLALPLRKDQPMEIYLMAILRFMLKPKRRIWSTDGVPVSVIVDAPKVVEQHLTKDFTGDEASDRLSYLAKIVDSRGWAAKGIDIPNGPSLSSAVLNEAESTVDVLDEDAQVAKSFDMLLARQKEVSRNAARQTMQGIALRMPGGAPLPLAPTPMVSNIPPPSPYAPPPATSVPGSQLLQYLPSQAPTARQAPQMSVIPNEAPSIAAAPTFTPMAQSIATPDMTQTVAPAILNLANNKDLSIQAIAHEAERMARNDELEVEIPLR